MNIPFHNRVSLMIMATLFASCSGLQPVGHVRDDVYFMPSGTNAYAGPDRVMQEEQPFTEDYFDQATADAIPAERSYYDVTYNDPHYFNQARFGFGIGVGMGNTFGMGTMGWQTGWGGPGWGSPMWWGDPWMNMSFGAYGPGMCCPMGMGAGWGWGNTWGMGGFHDPWCMSGPWGMGWGGGPYWGPWGSCWNCYAPVIVGGAAEPVLGHRPSIGGSGGGGTGGGGPTSRMVLRDPVSLTKGREGIRMDKVLPADPVRSRGASNTWGSSLNERKGEPVIPRNDQRVQPGHTSPRPQRPNDGSKAPQRSFQLRDGGSQNGYGTFERGGGGIPYQAPGGGGSRSPGTGRPR